MFMSLARLPWTSHPLLRAEPISLCYYWGSFKEINKIKKMLLCAHWKTCKVMVRSLKQTSTNYVTY